MSDSDLEGREIEVDGDHEKLGEKVGKGAEGAVYFIEGREGEEVAKIFEEEVRTEKADKVRAMVAKPPEDPTYKQYNTRSIVWPTEVIENGSSSGDFLGYKMPYQDLDQHKQIRRYAREHLRWDDDDREERERYRTAYNLAIVVYAIHKQGHAMGDLNHQNILVKDGYLSLIDCDGFHIQGETESYGEDVFFPRYTPPEGRGDTIKEVREGDKFGLGVHLFQVLMEGMHPYQASGDNIADGGFADWIREHPFPYEDPQPGIKPHTAAPDYDSLPGDIRELFAKCFGAGKKKGMARPSPKEWADTIAEVAEFDSVTTSSGSNESKDGTESGIGDAGNKFGDVSTGRDTTELDHTTDEEGTTADTHSSEDNDDSTSEGGIGDVKDKFGGSSPTREGTTNTANNTTGEQRKTENQPEESDSDESSNDTDIEDATEKFG